LEGNRNLFSFFLGVYKVKNLVFLTNCFSRWTELSTSWRGNSQWLWVCEWKSQRVRSEQFVIDSFFFQISLDLMSMVNLLMLLLLKNKKRGEKKKHSFSPSITTLLLMNFVE
jgi:hypothetical protein